MGSPLFLLLDIPFFRQYNNFHPTFISFKKERAMEFFLNEILENEEIKKQLPAEREKYPEAAEIAADIRANGARPKLAPGMLPLLVLSHLADDALRINEEKGVPREITVATLKDINIWIENHRQLTGENGVMEFLWLLHHFRGDLFRLGRLQFRIAKSIPGAPGEYAIETHIPQGSPLNAEECLASFAMARDFFARYFPQYAPKCFTCHSWLLSPDFAKILDEESNIVRFMRLWIQAPCKPDDSRQAIQRAFGLNFSREQLENAPENTRLQRALKAHLLSGGALNAAAGYRLLDAGE